MPQATCHCGAVRLSFPTLDLSSARRCDCSMCARRGAIMLTVPVEELTVEQGHTLRRYSFHTHTAQHYFCSICGIYTHHRRRSDPSEYGVNAACVEGVDTRSLDFRWVDGLIHPND